MDEGENDRADVARLRSRDPGDDPEDPYEGVDLSDLPEWWRRAVREFEEHGLRPYRPPRFADGTPTHEVVEPLEAELGIEVAFRRVGENAEWGVWIDDERVGSVGRHRSPEGYTVYEVESDAFEALVRSAIEG